MRNGPPIGMTILPPFFSWRRSGGGMWPPAQVTMMASTEGGMEIEEVAAKHPEKIIKVAIDPTTGFYFDDTKRYVDALDITDQERHMIFEGNARRVFSRMDAALKAKGI